MSGLNTSIRKGYHSDYFCNIRSKYPTISFAKKLLLIGNRIVCEKIIQVVFSTSETVTIIKHLLGYPNQLALFIK